MVDRHTRLVLLVLMILASMFFLCNCTQLSEDKTQAYGDEITVEKEDQGKIILEELETMEMLVDGNRCVYYRLPISTIDSVDNFAVKITATFLCTQDNSGNLIIYDFDPKSEISVLNKSGWDAVRATAETTGDCTTDGRSAVLSIKYACRTTSTEPYMFIEKEISFTL